MNNFVYHIPTKVYFGENTLGNLGKELSAFGKKVLLCYGGGSIKITGLYDKIISELNNAGLQYFELSGIQPNPRVTSVKQGAEICKREKIDVILAVGGGSVIDCAKFIGAAAFYNGDPWDLSTKKAPITDCLPIVTVLTLAATGSEMDPTGVISNNDTNDKLGGGAFVMLPRVSFLDPSNTFTVSAYQTACGSVDIMSHIFEVYFHMDNDLYMLDGFMEVLLKTVIKFAPIAMKHPDNYEARANLMWTSSWAINGFINGGKNHSWSCHPMEHELSAFYDITHGLGLAILTPRWLEFCLNDATLPRYKQFGVNVFGIDPSLPDNTVARMSIAMLSEFFFVTLGLRSTLSELGIDDSNFSLMAEKAVKNGRLGNAYVPLSPADVRKIYEMCL